MNITNKVVAFPLVLLACLVVVFTILGQPTLAVYMVAIATAFLAVTAIFVSPGTRSVSATNVISIMVLAAFLVYMVFRMAEILE